MSSEYLLELKGSYRTKQLTINYNSLISRNFLASVGFRALSLMFSTFLSASLCLKSQSKLGGHVLLLCRKIVSMFLTLPNTYVIPRISEILVLYRFDGHEKCINWFKDRLEVIDQNLEKDKKHCIQ